MIHMPIIVYEPTDVDIFNSVSALESYLEPYDVKSGRLTAYDRYGQLLKLEVVSRGLERVKLSGYETIIDCSSELRDHLKDFLSTLVEYGFTKVYISMEWVEQATLDELVNKIEEINKS